MTSFLIASRSRSLVTRALEKLYADYKIDTIDISILPSGTSSIGIEDIRQMQGKVMLRPIKSGYKAIIIQDGQRLTLQAQNALLKTLEEPPASTIIVIIADSEESLLPTIRSRCQVLRLFETEETADLSPAVTFIKNLSRLPIGDRLAEAERLARDKEALLTHLETILKAIHFLIKNTNEPEEHASYLRAGRELQQTYQTLKNTNTNPRLALEHLLLTAFDLP